MANTRHKDGNWVLPTNPDSGAISSWNYVPIAVLMDIRDELKQLNRVFACQNFLGMPSELQLTRRAIVGLRRDQAKKRLRKSAKSAEKASV